MTGTQPTPHPAAPIKAPVPYVGGKSSIAAEVWARLGTGADAPRHYIEPFGGMLAVLRCRPDWQPGVRLTETVNDVDGLLVNALRSMALAESEVIRRLTIRFDDEPPDAATVRPAAELEQRAWASWLLDHRGDITSHLAADPRWCDPEAAAWWLLGASGWIGSGWPTRSHQAPDLACRWGAGVLAMDGIERVRRMARRLRHVRTLCGDWRRCVSAPSVFGQNRGLSPCAVFLDPDYGEGVGYAGTAALDGGERRNVATEAWAWACEAADRWPDLRIAMAGYVAEDDPDGTRGPGGAPLPGGWSAQRWSTKSRQRGAGRAVSAEARARADRECVWFSPGCLSPRDPRQGDLFGEVLTSGTPRGGRVPGDCDGGRR